MYLLEDLKNYWADFKESFLIKKLRFHWVTLAIFYFHEDEVASNT